MYRPWHMRGRFDVPRPMFPFYPPHLYFPPPRFPYPPHPPGPPRGYFEDRGYFDFHGRPNEYQNESFNDTVHQLNQEPQVYLPQPRGDFTPPPPPNNMFRGRGNWQHYHQNHFSHERDDRPYRRRRSHLDDIYLPNYEDNDDLNESDDVNSYHNERFNSKTIGRWDVRHRIPKKGQKQDVRKRYLTPTKPHTLTSKDCIGDKDKTSDKCKDSAPDKPCVATKTAKKNVASDNSKEDIYDKDTTLTDECDKIKDSKKVLRIGQVKDNGEVETQNATETNAKNSNNHCGVVHIKPNTQINSVNSETNKYLVEKKCINDSKQTKADNESSTHKASAKSVDLEENLERVFAEPFLVIDDDSPKLAEGCPSKGIMHTPVSDERTDEDQKAITCHNLPVEFPTWERSYSSTVEKYQNPYMSVREIESDEETICYDPYITLDSIDTTKSYLGMDNFGPEFDDYRVTDMALSTPSPVKRKNSEEYEDVMMKKTKYDDCLYVEINSDQLLNELDEVLKGDKKNESIITRCIKRCRSKSLNLNTMPPKDGDILRRWRSLDSIDRNHCQVTCNFDMKTNRLVLLDDQKPSPIDDLKSRCSIVKDTDAQKENTNDSIVEKLDGNDGQICNGNNKEDIKKVTDNGIESVSNESKGKASGVAIEIDRVCKESEPKKNEKKIKDETELVQDAATPIKCGEPASKDEDNQKGQTNDIRTEKFSQKNKKSMSNDYVPRENAPKRDIDLKTIKPHSSIDSQKNTEGSSYKGKKIIEDRRKEKRTNDEANKPPRSVNIHPKDDNQVSTKSSSCSLVTYSDYKKSVDLLKKTAPPEMKMCAMMGSPKKLTARRMAFSNENELYLQKMFRLFGNDFFDIEMNNECGNGKNEDDKGGDNKSDSKKRKCEKDVGTHKREPQPKKLFTEPSEQSVCKVRSLEKARRCSTPGSSAREDVFKPPFIVDGTKAQDPNNTLQQAHSTSVIEKSKQPSDSHCSYKIAHKSKSIDKNKRRTSTPATSSGGNKHLSKNKPIPVSSVPQAATSTLQKTHKPEDNRKKDKNSKHAKSENSSRHESNSAQSTETSKDEKSRLNIDTGKDESRTIEKDSKKHGKPAKSRTNPKVVIENILKRSKDDKEGKPLSKVTDKNNKPSILPHNTTAKGETHKSNKDLHKNTMLKTTNAKQNPAIVQKPSSQLNTDNNNPPTNSIVLQPQLVLNRIDDQIPNIVNTKQKELSIEKAIESFASELNYVTCTTLVKDRFPMMQKARFFLTENECCDRAAILESAEVTDQMETVVQPVTSSKDASKERKEPSDDVIEIKPDIPVIDLTDDGSDVKEEKVEDPPKTKVAIKPNKKDDVDLAVDKPEGGNSEDRITLYRSDETLNNTLEVQAMVASISSDALRNNNCNKKSDIKSDDKPVVAVKDKDMPANTVVSTAPSASPQEVLPNNSNSLLSELLIERAINEAISQREQRITRGLPHQTTRGVENNVDAQNASAVTQLSSNAQYPTTQVPSNTTTQSPRRTGNDTGVQNLVTQTPRRTDSNTPPAIYNMLVANSRTVNSTSNKNLYSTAPGSTRIENSSQVDINVAVGPENSARSQNFFAAAQTPRRMEITGAPIPAGMVQNPRVESSSNEQDTTNLRRADCGTIQETSNVIACGASGELNVSVTAVSLAGESPRQNNNGVDGPLRALCQLTTSVTLSVESRDREVATFGLILSRYLYYMDGLKKAQMAYIEQIKKMTRCMPALVRTELIHFENTNSAKLYTLSNELVRDLKLLNMNLLSNLSNKMQPFMQSVYRSIRVEVPTLTMTWVYLLLEALMKPETAQYSEVPFLAALYRHVSATANHIRQLCEQNQGAVQDNVPTTANHIRQLCEQNQGAVQDNVPTQDPFTPEQRKQLEKQLLQYKTICTNQVMLFSMGNTLQTNLLRAHQNNQLLKANQQNKTNQQNNASGAIDPHASNTSGSSVNMQLYDAPGPPNVTLSSNNNIPRNPVVSQQGNSETLKSILLSTSSSKKSTKRQTSQASKQPGAAASSGSNSTIVSDIATLLAITTAPTPRIDRPDVPGQIFCATSRTIATSQTSKQLGVAVSSGSNSTIVSDIDTLPPITTAPTPRIDRPDVAGKTFCATPRSIARTPRRNSAPGTFKPIVPWKAPDGTNENFRIRLPFTMPYNISSSPSRTTTVAPQHSPRSTIQISGPNPSMLSPVRHPGAIPPTPLVIQDPGATPNRLQNPGVTTVRFSTVQNPGASPYRQNSGAITNKQSSDATPSTSSVVQNYGVAPFMSSRVPYCGASPSTSSRVPNSGANPSMSSRVPNPSMSSRVPNSGANPSMSSRVPNSGTSPSMSSRIQNSGASPSISSMVQSSHLSMPLLDEDVPSANVPDLSHIRPASRTPVYAPIIPLTHSIVRSPSPPLEGISDNDEVSIGDSLPVQEVVPSTSTQSTDKDSSQAVKNEKEQQNDVETIDLTWLDDIDPEQLQNEIEFIEVKKEEMIEEELREAVNYHQDPISMAPSPTDSGISSPNVQVEYNEQIFLDRTCICGKGADYICGCRMAMYCSGSCQLKDWKTHKEVCLKHNAKSTRDTTQS